ncbi:MAG: helix-turn-helix transcriptional regulator [Clostridia bacterium]|nr:helix-turn-helix transcriptional regulator [Clostridia bacterium]
MIKLGEKIKSLRKEKNISQEIFANYLGVSFQAVSKWENGNTMPDVTMIPAIASFFSVSTDELFDFNLYEIEKNVDAIVDEYSKYWYADKAKAEQVIRDGLKKYPGNDILLNCLIGVLSELGKNDEVITVGKALVESTKHDDVRFDAYRIMAEAYKAKGEYQLAKDAIEHIPEIYFSKLGVAAHLLEDDEMYEAAQKHKNISAEDLIDMLIIAGKHLKDNGENEKADSQFRIALKIIDAFKEDFVETKYFKSTIYEYTQEQRKELGALLGE